MELTEVVNGGQEMTRKWIEHWGSARERAGQPAVIPSGHATENISEKIKLFVFH